MGRLDCMYFTIKHNKGDYMISLTQLSLNLFRQIFYYYFEFLSCHKYIYRTFKSLTLCDNVSPPLMKLSFYIVDLAEGDNWFLILTRESEMYTNVVGLKNEDRFSNC
jgi:hypothetical protein